MKHQDRILFGTDNDPVLSMYLAHARQFETEDEWFSPADAEWWRGYGMGLPDAVLAKVYRAMPRSYGSGAAPPLNGRTEEQVRGEPQRRVRPVHRPEVAAVHVVASRGIGRLEAAQLERAANFGAKNA